MTDENASGGRPREFTGEQTDDVYGAAAPNGYALVGTTPTVDEFQRLRDAAGMSPRGRAAVERGLPNTTYGVHARIAHTSSDPAAGEAVGMARIVGDGGSVFHVSDMAVDPAHQRRGIGSAMMDALMGYVRAEAPDGAYVNLMADVDGFYERWGFRYAAPASKGMYLRTEEL